VQQRRVGHRAAAGDPVDGLGARRSLGLRSAASASPRDFGGAGNAGAAAAVSITTATSKEQT